VVPHDKRPTIDSERLEDIEPAWRELHAAAGAPPFAHPAWIAAWLDTLGSVAATVFLAVRRDDELLGVAPLELGPLTAQAAGDANVFDYTPILAARGEEAAVRLAILEWLREDLTPELLDWGLPGAVAANLEEEAGYLGWNLAITEEAIAPRADLTGSWNSYIATLSKKDRHELRRKMRNLEATGDVTFEVVRSGDEFGAALDALVAMMARSHREKAKFLERYGRFFRGAATAMADEGLAAISTLSIDGTAAGRVLTFEHGGVCYLYNSGYDPAYANIGAGLISKAFVLRDAIERGLSAFDFLRGDEDYKRRLGGIPHPVFRATYHQR
jgi:CelD/BcsL family acetyltransferase involved in cellulose biosynthesis